MLMLVFWCLVRSTQPKRPTRPTLPEVTDAANAAEATDTADAAGADERFGGAAGGDRSESVAAGFWQRSALPPYATRNFRRGIPLAASPPEVVPFTAGRRPLTLAETASVHWSDAEAYDLRS